MIDGATNSVTDTIAVGNGPFNVAVDPTTDTVYVTNAIDETMSVIDGATDSVTDTITVGGSGDDPRGVAVDTTTDTVYVANDNNSVPGTVSVIDGATNTVTATVDVGAYPTAVDVDPTTHTAYVANSNNGGIGSVSAISVLPPPTITSFSPSSGTPGTTVTITGTNLSGATKVTFNGKSGSISSDTASTIMAVVPVGATTGPIEVTAPGGSATSAVTSP